MSNLIGQSLGRYHILEQLGEGGMAAVYKAFDTKLERDVAVKVILPYRQHTEKFLKRFEREARALAKLSHPNILKIFDSGEYQSLPYLVMEYIPGGTLATMLKGRPLPWQASANMIMRVAKGLEAAHLQDIIHRDVKPSNILIAPGGEPLLSDFGIAKLVEGDEETMDLTGTGVGIGTPQYMAPEQGMGRSDAKSDVYALGVIFYEMVTGHKPYQADTPMAIMLKKNTEPLPRPTVYVPGLPARVENVLIKALTREPANRYSMREFIQALEVLLGQTSAPVENTFIGTVTFDDSPISSTIQEGGNLGTVHRQTWVVWAVGGAAAVVIVCIVAVGSLLIGRSLFSPRPISTAEFTDTAGPIVNPTESPMPSASVGSTVLPPAVADSPVPDLSSPIAIGETLTEQARPQAGTLIAFNSKTSGNANIYLVDINGNNLTELTKSTAHDLYPSWSPDGGQIVFQTNEGGDQELAIVEIATGNIRKLTSNTCEDWGPSWSPAGEWIVFYSDCNGERDIYKIQSNGNGRQQLTYSTGAYSWFPSWSWDGRQITFTSNRSDGYHIYIMNADGSNQRELAQGCVSYFSPDGSQILYGVYCDDTDDLWLMNSDGSNQRQITNGFECKNATWSPDGTKIVFEQSPNGRDGPFAIFVLALNDPDPSNWIQLTDYDINGRAPVWQP